MPVPFLSQNSQCELTGTNSLPAPVQMTTLVKKDFAPNHRENLVFAAADFHESLKIADLAIYLEHAQRKSCLE